VLNGYGATIQGDNHPHLGMVAGAAIGHPKRDDVRKVNVNMIMKRGKNGNFQC